MKVNSLILSKLIKYSDPIDPDFISSRRASYINPTSPQSSENKVERRSPPSPPFVSRSQSLRISQSPHHITTSEHKPASFEEKEGTEEDSERIKRKTIAERMARLGGIKFGIAPIPGTAHRPISKGLDAEQSDETGNAPEESDGGVEEEERARKDRIAARLAQIGGMRIGMMPTGIGSIPAPESRSVSCPLAENTSPPNRPSRPIPAPNQLSTVNSESASAYASDDAVKVEAEESETEEINYQDAEPEEVPPSLPSRDNRPARRRESTDTVASSSSRTYRPPVPAAPPRRSSMHAHVSEPLQGAPQRKSSYNVPQSDFVMVEQEDLETTATRTSRAPPARRAPEIPMMEDSQENISSQWELPSIPTANMDSTDAELSLSWIDDGESHLPGGDHPQPSQASVPQPKTSMLPAVSKVMTADELIAVWGRVGVQVCEVATTLFEKSKKSLIGDGTYEGFVKVVLAQVPNVADVSIDAKEYGYVVYSQNGSTVQKRASDIMPGDIIELHDAKFKGHKGLHTYQQTVGGSGEFVIGIVGEFDTKKSKIKVFQANQHVGQQVGIIRYDQN